MLVGFKTWYFQIKMLIKLFIHFPVLKMNSRMLFYHKELVSEKQQLIFIFSLNCLFMLNEFHLLQTERDSQMDTLLLQNPQIQCKKGLQLYYGDLSFAHVEHPCDKDNSLSIIHKGQHLLPCIVTIYLNVLPIGLKLQDVRSSLKPRIILDIALDTQQKSVQLI